MIPKGEPGEAVQVKQAEPPAEQSWPKVRTKSDKSMAVFISTEIRLEINYYMILNKLFFN